MKYLYIILRQCRQLLGATAQTLTRVLPLDPIGDVHTSDPIIAHPLEKSCGRPMTAGSDTLKLCHQICLLFWPYDVPLYSLQSLYTPDTPCTTCNLCTPCTPWLRLCLPKHPVYSSHVYVAVCIFAVASLGLVSTGAATDGVTLFFAKKTDNHF